MPKKAERKSEKKKAAPIAPAKEQGQEARPAAPAARPASDVLVLHHFASKVPTTPGVVSLEWIYAVGPAAGRLSDFKNVICFSGVMGSDDARRELAVEARDCIRAGARVLFLIHAEPKGFDEWSIGHLGSTKELFCKPDCNKDRQLIYMSIGMDVVYVGNEGRRPPRPAAGTPTGVLDAHMAKYPSNFRVVNCSPLALAEGEQAVTCWPLWEWGVTDREPAAAAGTLGAGEWAVLPGPAEPNKCDMVDLVRMVKAMDGWATGTNQVLRPPVPAVATEAPIAQRSPPRARTDPPATTVVPATVKEQPARRRGRPIDKGAMCWLPVLYIEAEGCALDLEALFRVCEAEKWGFKTPAALQVALTKAVKKGRLRSKPHGTKDRVVVYYSIEDEAQPR